MTPLQRFTSRQLAVASGVGSVLLYGIIWLAAFPAHPVTALKGGCGCITIDSHPLAFFASLVPMFLPIGYGFLLMRGGDLALLKPGTKLQR